jgi:hypothetical protein
MRSTYRGYDINVERARCLGGWDLIYYQIVRKSDGWFALDAFTDSDETVREVMRSMKIRIDNEHNEEDPWGERAEAEEWGR